MSLTLNHSLPDMGASPANRGETASKITSHDGSDPIPSKFAYDIADSDLLSHIEFRDAKAMEMLFDRYATYVYSIALRVLRDSHEAEDVLQDVFLRIWRSPGSFTKVEGTLAAWITTTVRHRAIDHLRRRRPSIQAEDCDLYDLRDVAKDAESNLMGARAKILMVSLPSEQQDLLEMAFFKGLTHSEIAVATMLPLGTVKTRIRAGLLSLRKGFRCAAA